MDPSQNTPSKKSVIPLIGAEGAIIIVLVILIGFTFNYFNILPFSIPYLPNQKAGNQVAQQRFITSEGTGRCQNLPKNLKIDIKQPSSTISAALAAYSGIWQGKWGGEVPSALIISEITQTSVYTIYVYRGQPQAVSFKVKGDKFSTPPFFWQMSKNNTLSGVRRVDASSAASFIEMEKCKP